MITRRAYAKVNLGLEITGRRDDGYHNVVSVMQLFDLHDTLLFTPHPEIEVTTDNPVLMAEGRSNLVWRAARLLQESASGAQAQSHGQGQGQGAHIEVQKRIPLAAGLGGGSSDAAATLLGLSELWGLNLSRDEMRNLAAMLGSDVPFFLEGTTALIEGRGDRVTPLPPSPPMWAVLVCPPLRIPNKTERLYGSLDRQDFTPGVITRQLASAVRRGEAPPPSLLYNGFERAAYRAFEELDQVRQRIVRAGGDNVRLSGSGPTLYVLFPESEEERARSLLDALRDGGDLRVYLTRSVE